MVGAGPVGLAMALALARHEVPSIVLDQGGGVYPEGPRSAVLGADTTALLERLGYPRAASDAARWNRLTVWRRRQEVLGLDLADHPVLHLSQHRLQRGLRDAASASPLVQLVPHARVEEIDQDGDGVSVRTRHPQDGTQTWWRASHLIGCDGARSAVRKLLGIRFPGRPAVDRHAIATVRVDLPFPGEARVHREPPWRGDREASAQPLPDGLWRLDWRLPPGRPAPSEPVDPHATWPGVVTGDTLLTRVKATLTGWCGELPRYELLAAADHTAQQRLAARYRSGRCFLAGDAAHLHGALGMQNLADGLRDVDNLAWRLAIAWHLPGGARSGGTLLDGYEAERRTAVGARLRAVDQSMPLLRPLRGWQQTRRSLLTGSFRKHAPLLADGLLGTGRFGGAPAYPEAPAGVPVQRGTGRGAALTESLSATAPGVLVADVPVLTTEGVPDRLYARLGAAFVLLLVAPGTAVWSAERWLGAGLMPRLAEVAGALPVPAEVLVTEEYPEAGPHTVLLIRPDGHLVGATQGAPAEELLALAERARGGPEALAGAERSA
ncbi:3-(3-hydroxy-phenyl)propionate hydroxylase [Kitasatospora viridis]|uniref:3-(3-hydroxy-phenyl)propionate hydroxylase n=1 Tax=Kitasatospora viridis TaxID=281105 RepID=A0A561UE45_9ACTN|nr:3-(3-hydroxy-phenyl)propionate hydroxylase [Kitasatospora viridis]